MLTRFHFFVRNSANFSKLIFQQHHISVNRFFHCGGKQNSSKTIEFISSSMPLTETEIDQKFKSVIPEVFQTIKDIEYLNEIPQAKKLFRELLTYNLFDGKKNRGLQTVLAYCMFSRQLDEENLKLASILGWCVELLQAFYLVHDDIIDGAELRRGRPCWYRIHNNGLNAINDGVLLENSIYILLQKYFKNKPYYTDIIESFHDATMKTSLGQVLDMHTSRSFQMERKFDKFTLQNYTTIVKYKTTFYTFQLPVTIAMYMAGIKEGNKHEKVANVLLNIGQYYQIQDDFLDCFGDKKMTGKSGTDIAEGKCTWLVVNALNRANIEQEAILLENYGNPDPEKINSVLQIYNEIGMKKRYDEYETQAYRTLMIEIEELSNNIPPEIFILTLDKIYRRKC